MVMLLGGALVPTQQDMTFHVRILLDSTLFIIFLPLLQYILALQCGKGARKADDSVLSRVFAGYILEGCGAVQLLSNGWILK